MLVEGPQVPKWPRLWVASLRETLAPGWFSAGMARFCRGRDRRKPTIMEMTEPTPYSWELLLISTVIVGTVLRIADRST